MSEQVVIHKEQNEYITGAFFGLVTLDLFMFLTHCLIEGTTTGYSLSTLVITLPILLVIYFVGKKLSRVMFVISLFTYSIGVLYLIDVFNFSKDGIILTLTISAVVLMVVGYYLVKRKY